MRFPNNPRQTGPKLGPSRQSGAVMGPRRDQWLTRGEYCSESRIFLSLCLIQTQSVLVSSSPARQAWIKGHRCPTHWVMGVPSATPPPFELVLAHLGTNSCFLLAIDMKQITSKCRGSEQQWLVSVGQEFGCMLPGWFWSGVFQAVAVRLGQVGAAGTALSLCVVSLYPLCVISTGTNLGFLTAWRPPWGQLDCTHGQGSSMSVPVLELESTSPFIT